MQIDKPPILTIQKSAGGAAQSVMASGVWQVSVLTQCGLLKGINRTLAGLKKQSELEWDLTEVDSIDHIGAQMFWNAWGKKRPARLRLDPRQEDLFKRIEDASQINLPRTRVSALNWIIVLGQGLALRLLLRGGQLLLLLLDAESQLAAARAQVVELGHVQAVLHRILGTQRMGQPVEPSADGEVFRAPVHPIARRGAHRPGRTVAGKPFRVVTVEP